MQARQQRMDRRHTGRIAAACLSALLLASPFTLGAVTSAWALSEIPEDAPATPPAQEGTEAPAKPGTDAAEPPEATTPDEDEGGVGRPDIDPNEPPPEIIYNLDRLPEPVRRMHDRIVETAKTGDIEKLRPLLGVGDDMTQLSFGGVEGDVISFLKGLSGDEEGQEILAILEEVLGAGFVHLDAGTPEELYVWPYFFAIPLDKLDSRQRVELFKIVTAGDYEDMKQFGSYIFYRLGIDPQGRWIFFVAGD